MGREERRRFAVLARVRAALDGFYRGQDVDEGYSLGDALGNVLALAMGELEFTEGRRAGRALIVLRSSDGSLEVSAAWGDLDAEAAFSRTVVEEVLRTGADVVLRDAVADARFREAESLRRIRSLSVLAIPLVVEGTAAGALYLDSSELAEAFTDDDVEFLRAFAEVLGPHLKSALLHQRHLDEIRRLKTELAGPAGFGALVGGSSPMRSVFHLSRRVAADPDVRVLILGESGTGKELVARGIHTEGPRAARPFVALNCAAIPRELLESELFGHERGAFTGAVSRRIGRFEEADGGTLFLDEIGDLDPDLQAKLLRVLEAGTFRRLGSATEIAVDVRLLAATHHDLRDLVRTGRFREDLYHRLNVVTVRIPPLRERPDDVPLLAQHFLDRLNRRKDRTVQGFTPEAMEALCGAPWPGNVRELENVVERGHLLCDSDWMDRRHLPTEITGSSSPAIPSALEGGPFAEDLSLREISRRYVRIVVERAATKTEACRILGITDKTLNRLLREAEGRRKKEPS